MKTMIGLPLFLFGLTLLVLTVLVDNVRQNQPQVWMFFNNDGNFYRMRPDGTHRTLLHKGLVGPLTWSPDKRTFIATAQQQPGVRFRHLYRFEHMGQKSQPIIEKAYRSFLVRRSPRNQGFIFMAISQDSLRNIHTPSKLFFMTRHARDVRDITPPQSNLRFGGWTPDGEWIIFSGLYAGTDGVFRVRLDGSDFGVLISTSGPTRIIDLSADGEWIVYLVRDAQNDQQLFRVPTDGGQSQQLSDGRDYIDTAWLSPDGQWIIFQDSSGSNITLNRIRLDGTGEIFVAENAVSILDFSSDSEMIYYLVLNGNVPNLYWANVQNPQESGLIGEDVSWNINWSPNRRYFAYIRTTDVLMTYDTAHDTPHLIGILSIRHAPNAPIWSPDSQWVYFAQYSGDPHQNTLYRRRSDGSDQMPVMDVATDFEILGWSPVIDLDWNAQLLTIIGLVMIGGSLCAAYWSARS